MLMTRCHHFRSNVSLFRPSSLSSSRIIPEDPVLLLIHRLKTGSSTHFRWTSSSCAQRRLPALGSRAPPNGDDSGPSSKKYHPLPIMKRHATNAGYVSRILATDPNQISKLELQKWLKKQTFGENMLGYFVKALQQPDWTNAIAIVDQAYDGQDLWISHLPSSVLAELATKKLTSSQDFHDLMTIIGYRISEEDDILITSQLLNGALRASLSFGNLVCAGEIIDYAIRFANEIARVEVEKQLYLIKSSIQSHSQPSDGSIKKPDTCLALRPLISCIAALTSQSVCQSRTSVSKFLAQLIRALLNLCGDLASLLSRLSKPNIHLVCRAMITSSLYSEGYSMSSTQVDLILQQNLPISTLRLAMIAMIHSGDQDRANAIEKLAGQNLGRNEIFNVKHQFDVALHQARRCKIRAYSSSEKLHQQFFSKLASISGQSSKHSIQAYTLYMSTLLRHHLPKLALEVWDDAMRRGLVPDATAIQVAMSIYLDLGRPLDAVGLFTRFAFPKSRLLSHDTLGPARIGSSTAPNIQLLATYARALDASGRHLEVYALWKNLEADWGLEPDERIFASLVSSARKLTLHRAVFRSSASSLSLNTGLHTEPCLDHNHWDDQPPGEVAMQLFWTILYQNWPSLSSKVRAPIKTESFWFNTAMAAHKQILKKLGKPNPSTSPVMYPRRLSRRFAAQFELATSVMPSLEFKTEWATIVPNRYSFRDMVELLGAHDQADLIPLLLSWMREIGTTPDQDLITRSYCWLYRSSIPVLKARREDLDEFVKSWINELGYSENEIQIPTEEMLDMHYLDRARWTNRLFFFS
ncbi:hypothetical protein O181_023317 [Austropuccinia psidii MF-1]|uniref:Uncharacterized protein n=1 Tax=Austropuccinia psidii MF-1 TaxID=1389203 RepID=A0A9Q3CJA5_9BASI|nr:hypothetical protein [Austropuccinia psidii MF-1]